MSKLYKAIMGVALIMLGGCGWGKTQDFLVGHIGDSTVIYKPETILGPKDIQLQIPWINLAGCPKGKIVFEVGSPAEWSWSLSKRLLLGTVAEFDKATMQLLAKVPYPLNDIKSSIRIESPCQLKLAGNTPPEIKKEVSDNSEQENIQALLALLVSSQLPRAVANTWIDQYDYDSTSNSLNVLAGMRLRVEHVTPLSADLPDQTTAHPGTLAAPIYLNLFGGSLDGTRAVGTWSIALRTIGINKNGNPSAGFPDPRAQWVSVSSIGELLSKEERYWRLFFPTGLNKSITHDAPFSFVKEKFWEKFNAPRYPAITLVGATKKDSLIKFLEESKKAIRDMTKNCNDLYNGDTDGNCFIFRYRAFLVPEISVEINGLQEWVEIGTRVGDVVRRVQPAGLRELMETPSASVALNEFSKNYNAIATSLSAQKSNAPITNLVVRRQLRGKSYHVSPERDGAVGYLPLLDLELQIGDQVTWSR